MTCFLDPSNATQIGSVMAELGTDFLYNTIPTRCIIMSFWPACMSSLIHTLIVQQHRETPYGPAARHHAEHGDGRGQCKDNQSQCLLHFAPLFVLTHTNGTLNSDPKEPGGDLRHGRVRHRCVSHSCVGPRVFDLLRSITSYPVPPPIYVIGRDADTAGLGLNAVGVLTNAK